jgi:predicted ATPase
MHTKGYAASDTVACLDQARSYMEQAQALGEPPEDPLMLFSVLYGFWVANVLAFNGDAVRDLATQFLALAEKQGATIPLMIGHRLMGRSFLDTGDIAEARAHCDQAVALYDPAKHRSLATRFGQDSRVATLSFRLRALWLLGYPDAALADANHALKDAREIGQAAALMFALAEAAAANIFCGSYAAASTQVDELVTLADEKGGSFWKPWGMTLRGCVFASTGEAPKAIQMITSGITAYRSTGSTMWEPLYLPHLARAYVELGQFDDAWRGIVEAMTAVETTRERSAEADIQRTAGEIALMSPERDEAKAETYFKRAFVIARTQRAKSWELRTAMSMARLWRDQGKRQQAHDLLAPVYGWFTEGFDTLDLKQAKALLDELR